MNNQELEQEIKNIFRKSQLNTTRSSRFRLLAILKRGLHELAVRDLINLIGHITMVMVTLLSGLAGAAEKRSPRRID